MRTLGIVAAAVAALVSAAAGLAAADPRNPLDVIEQLELAGYTVTVDRIGNAPIQDCVVTGLRNPQQITVPAVVIGGAGGAGGHGGRDDGEVVDVVVHQSISVSLDCAR
ncbi:MULTISPECIES: hypothetical protein [Mycobacteriaceae]|uniref:Uncharacterized protein n=1 Tax=Mycolicibacterium parafortuitum TaxID=39692 RepID=A0ACC6MNV7_MYCPF|nr:MULTISPECIES: hypothetical protein [Mycobacteriaceae]MDZ5088644.1 hypothetical protein [Mycolicibacterium parafortuitum]GFM21296.1 uncharacterized protein PO1_contig-119-23 [Mycobacterium sp. PO1]GFM25051.1 uncharacterized protein PO2_contig-057-83 [Mycobacterium sp. PO2]